MWTPRVVLRTRRLCFTRYAVEHGISLRAYSQINILAQHIATHAFQRLGTVVIKETTIAMSLEELNGVDLGQRSVHELYKRCFSSIDMRFEGNYKL